MKEFQRRQKMRRWMYSLPACLLLLVVTTFLVQSTVKVVGKQVESAEKVSDLKSKAAVLSAREVELEENIAQLDTDKGRVRELKEKFNVSGEGEYMVVIVDEEDDDASTKPQKTPWFKRLWTAIIPE